jgi:hypothetical protein
MSRKQNLNKTKRITLSLPEQTIEFFEALALSGGFEGSSVTEVATSILQQRAGEMANQGVLEKRQKTLTEARSIVQSRKAETESDKN